MQNSKYAKDFQQRMEKEFGPKQNNIVAKKKNLRTKHEALDRDKDVLSKTEKETKEKEFMKLQEEVMRLEEELGHDVQHREQAEMQRLKNELEIIFKELAKSEKIDMFMTDQVVLYNAKASSNYTEKVMNALDKKHEK